MLKTKFLEPLVGFLVLTIAVVFFMYVTQSTNSIISNKDIYRLSADFRSAEGVKIGSDVRLAGVKIGTVHNIALDKQTYRAVTDFSVDNNVQIPDDSSANIASEGLLGGYFIDIVPGGSEFNFQPNDIIVDTQSAVSFTSLLLNFFSRQ